MGLFILVVVPTPQPAGLRRNLSITKGMKLCAILIALPVLAVSEVLWKDVCTQDDVKALPFCDMKLDIPKRAADYVSRLTTEEKISIMTNEASAVSKLHIPPYQWGSEGLHGPLQPCVCDTKKVCKCPTSFPMPSALGCAFNDSMVRAIGRAIGREARAINNLRNHKTQNNYGDGIDYWSPTINMQRDPRWGRNMEVPGEDPMHTGNYAINFVKGIQEGDDVSKVQIIATCKHFVANSLEGWKGHTRHNFDAKISAQDLSNYYLPAFKTCVTEGKAKVRLAALSDTLHVFALITR
jgi:beta-D-xylosidase 4